ncbi:aldehyde dehydrogenase family protein [Streptomyces sp. SL13]|jgi:acyl-CoA reductase-like NAD-dependent aldehyde dehydrogenase|uniref:Aldehyde dehydrogenase family protein n=1 Tax=Streptantibioticus silvisoli TaxID=2705255 RepID=A0AA90H166_9ACTN|nr:aldehyde dehydrogenase family protein [Streptantibioticus silvisoli]MDI5962478.1 aldehyde dehydrogenase family protein [Streptantibioticus silvisoli]MDI5969113.1 aldehyde dehydrogenase family protein [Streptantibioticus silvisoli]
MLLDGTTGESTPPRPGRCAAAPDGRPDAAPTRSYPLYIAGKDLDGDGWVYTVSGRALLEDVFTSVSLKRSLERDPDSPQAGHPYVVGRCAVAGDGMIDLATEAAAAAAPGWAALPLDHRMRLGTRFRQELVRRSAEFLRMLTDEAHPAKLARWELSCLLQIYSEESLGWYRRQMHTEFRHGDRRLIVRRQPDGVVAFNPPQNAPLPSAALAVLCLMAGNAVVMRAPRSIALSTMWLMRDVVAPLLDELGAPPGTLNAVCSNPKQTMDRWVASPLIDDIFYIGGSAEGLRFEQECVAHGKKPILELAGNDGMVVWHDADIPLAAEAVTEAFYGSGQICMVPNYVLAHPAIADELLAAVKERVAGIRPGYPEDEDVLLSPVRRSERFFRLLRQATDAGAQVVTGGRRTEIDGTPSQTGVFLEPTVVKVTGLAAARTYDLVREETFFPLIPVIVPEEAPDEQLLDAFLDFVNSNEYGLRNSLWSRSDGVIDFFVDRVVNGGLLKVNDSHIGFLPYLPSHGGTGLTGGAFGEANYPMLRTSHVQGVSIGRDISPYRAVFGD